MSEEAKKIIDKLEKVDNVIYKCAFEFADSSSFDEVCDCFYERNVLAKETERLNNIIEDIDTYIHLWKLDDIGEKTMLILNDILLIKNGMRNEVVRLGSDK